MMNKKIKIYTKGGDKGETSLLGGTRVPKYHERIEAYGTVDELNSFVGLVRDIVRDDHVRDDHVRDILLKIQHNLFIAESHLASDQPENNKNLPLLTVDDITLLEEEIDKMNEDLSPLKSFILPGGHVAVSYCHVSRTVCRRAERLTIKLSEKYEIDGLIIKYLNRLSDYFFVLGRKLSRDFGVDEVIWNPLK